jgi:hypothetical protein
MEFALAEKAACARNVEPPAGARVDLGYAWQGIP